MKRSHILSVLIGTMILQSQGLNVVASATDGNQVVIGQRVSQSGADRYVAELEQYSQYVEAVSGGSLSTNRVLIRVAGHTFYDFDAKRIRLAGIYVVAIYNNQVVLKHLYHTYQLGGASIGFADDMRKLPYGSFVIVAAKEEPTRLFEKKGQYELYQIGAANGLLNQAFRTSYLCIGIKGLGRGKAIEKIGTEELRHVGSKANEKIDFSFIKREKTKRLSRKPGKHEGLIFDETEVIYYIPKSFDPDTAQYLVGIHGAGDWRRRGALTRIAQFRNLADRENLVLIAPTFDCILNRRPDPRTDFDEHGRYKDSRIVKDWYEWGFIALANDRNEHRTDLKLIEIFEFFNKRLMKRDKFILDGHSGGGQFVSRFVFFYPELIERAAICSAGSFVFPRRDIDYPYGLKLDNLEQTFGPQVKADDLKLTEDQINQKLNEMLALKIHIIAGEKETVQEDRPERDWQGKSTLEKAKNFFEAMREEDKRLKEKGLRASSKPYQYELHVIPGAGHDSHATAKKAVEVLFSEK